MGNQVVSELGPIVQFTKAKAGDAEIRAAIVASADAADIRTVFTQQMFMFLFACFWSHRVIL